MFSSQKLEKDMYLIGEVASYLGMTTTTLRRWEKEGKVKFFRTEGRQRFLDRDGLIALLKDNGRLPDDFEYVNDRRIDVLYCRVSSLDQKKHGDLDRQAVYLMNHVKNLVSPEVIADVGSGLDENRKGYLKLLELVLEGKVKTVYVTYKDRLTRFGFKTLEKVFASHGTQIIAVHSKENNKEAEKELMDDMMSLIASFSGKLYSLRSKKNREKA